MIIHQFFYADFFVCNKSYFCYFFLHIIFCMKAKINHLKPIKHITLFLSMMCSMIGAGFFSGAEIYQFFARFGYYSIIGIVLFFGVCFFVVYKMLLNKLLKQINDDKKLFNHETNLKNQVNSVVKIKNETEFKLYNSSKKYLKNTFLNKVAIKEILLFFNFLLISGAMISGLKFLIFELLKNNNIFIFLSLILIVFLCVCFDFKGLEKFNLIVFGLFVFVLVCVAGEFEFFKISVQANNFNCFQNITISSFLALLYVFMNVGTIQPVIDSFNFDYTKKYSFKIAFLFSLFLTIVISFYVLFLFQIGEGVVGEQMPLLSVFQNMGRFEEILFIIGMFFALISTLISCLIGAKRDFEKVGFSKITAVLGAMLSSLILSQINFSTFVSYIYPVVGFINFVIYVFL